jgi:hypothetical protein
MKALVLVFALAASAVAKDDIVTISMPGGGSITLSGRPAVQVAQFNIHRLMLFLDVSDDSSAPWENVKLRISVGVACKDAARIWTREAVISHGLPYADQFNKSEDSLQDCEGVMFNAKLFREGDDAPLLTVEEVAERHKEHESARDMELAKERKIIAEKVAAARKRIEARNAAEASSARKAAELDRERAAVAEAERRAEAAKIRALCSGVYIKTIDTKVRNLTVREEQQVRTCQALGLYPPR